MVRYENYDAIGRPQQIRLPDDSVISYRWDDQDNLAANAPHLLPDGFEAPQPGAVGRAFGKIFG